MADAPLWRRLFDAVERPVGTRLEQLVQTGTFADVAAWALRARAEAGRRVESVSRSALHRVNLPAASDVAALRRQVASLERSVRQRDATTGTTGTTGRPGADGSGD